MTTDDYNAESLAVSQSEGQSDEPSVSITPIGEIAADSQSYRERAKQLHQQRWGNNQPPDVVDGTEKSDENFHPVEVWDDVPSVNDNYFDRRERLFEGGWKDEEQFLKLYHGEFQATQFNQREAESILANRFSFAFGKNADIVAFEMENLPFETDYANDPWHRKSCLEFAQTVDSIYCEGVDILTKRKVALYVLLLQETTVSELSDCIEMSESHVGNVLNILEAEELVNREQSDMENESDVWTDTGITDSYLENLLSHKERLEDG